MDKTERLFAVMDALRRHRRPVTAATLAEEQGVSVRTLYRDVQTLIGLGAPIDGEAGVGYMLKPGFFLPPLMFTADELEALVLGARWVGAQPDDGLGAAARNALAKIATASPEDLRDRINDTGLWPVAVWSANSREPMPVLGQVRQAMRTEKALRIAYEDENGNADKPSHHRGNKGNSEGGSRLPFPGERVSVEGGDHCGGSSRGVEHDRRDGPAVIRREVDGAQHDEPHGGRHAEGEGQQQGYRHGGRDSRHGAAENAHAHSRQDHEKGHGPHEASQSFKKMR